MYVLSLESRPNRSDSVDNNGTETDSKRATYKEEPGNRRLLYSICQLNMFHTSRQSREESTGTR